MPTTYKVTAPGFHGGHYYHPEGKRKTLTVDKPFKKKEMPKWLIEMPEESIALATKREAQEKSRNAATKFIKEQITVTEKKVKAAEKKVDKAKGKDKDEAEKELSEARVELASLESLLDDDKPEESTQQQVAKASSIANEAGEGGFLDKVKDKVGLGDDSSKVETL